MLIYSNLDITLLKKYILILFFSHSIFAGNIIYNVAIEKDNDLNTHREINAFANHTPASQHFSFFVGQLFLTYQ